MYVCIKTISVGPEVYIEGKEYNKSAVTKHLKSQKVNKVTDYFAPVATPVEDDSTKDVDTPVQED